MAVSLSLYEGIVIVVMSVLSIFAYWEIRHIHNVAARVDERSKNVYDSSMVNLQRMENMVINMENMVTLYTDPAEEWKAKIQENLEIPLAEHLFIAFFNTLVSLGASDMGKEGTAKQNMAINGFQKIGRAIAKGIKKEIPQIEALQGMTGGGGGGGDMISSLASSVLGFDIPPGIMGALAGGGKAPPDETVKAKKKEDTFWKG